MADDEAKRNRPASDSEEINRLLEIELIQKRAAWQQASSRYKTLKSVSILFLFVVILGALLGFYFVMMRVSENRGNPKTTLSPAPSP